MIRLTIALEPHGDASRSRNLAEVSISNVGGDREVGDYAYRLYEPPSPFSNGVEIEGSLSRHNRHQPVLALVAAVLQDAFRPREAAEVGPRASEMTAPPVRLAPEDCSDVIKAKKRLGKLVFHRITEPRERPYGGHEFWVVFRDKDKVKCGLLSSPFTTRYGITVEATYGGGERWWSRSDDAVPSHARARMRALHDDAPVAAIGPVVDLNDLEWRA